MKIWNGALFLLLLALASGRSEETPAPPLVLPKMVVEASPEVPFFTVSWKSKGFLPYSKIKRAWFSKITPGGAADKAGVKVGDQLLSFGGVAVETMSGLQLKMSSLRPREYGTREEIVFRTANGETRSVEFVYEKIKQQPGRPPEPAPRKSP